MISMILKKTGFVFGKLQSLLMVLVNYHFEFFINKASLESGRVMNDN